MLFLRNVSGTLNCIAISEIRFETLTFIFFHSDIVMLFCHASDYLRYWKCLKSPFQAWLIRVQNSETIDTIWHFWAIFCQTQFCFGFRTHTHRQFHVGSEKCVEWLILHKNKKQYHLPIYDLFQEGPLGQVSWLIYKSHVLPNKETPKPAWDNHR